MGVFKSELIVEVEQELEHGRGVARLVQPFVYWTNAGEVVTVPAGYETDFASVPWWAQFVFHPFDLAAKAAVLHDWLTDHHASNADAIFLEAMTDLGVPAWRRFSMWLAVHYGLGIERGVAKAL